MFKKIIFKLCLLVYIAMPLISTAQMIELDTLFVNHIKEIKKKDVWIEEFGEGPYVNGKLVINNNQKGNIVIGNRISISYYHDGLLCNSLPYFTSANNEYVITPTDSLILTFDIPLMFGTTKESRVYYIQNDYETMDYNYYIEELIESVCVTININHNSVEVNPENIVVYNKGVLLE